MIKERVLESNPKVIAVFEPRSCGDHLATTAAKASLIKVNIRRKSKMTYCCSCCCIRCCCCRWPCSCWCWGCWCCYRCSCSSCCGCWCCHCCCSCCCCRWNPKPSLSEATASSLSIVHHCCRATSINFLNDYHPQRSLSWCRSWYRMDSSEGFDAWPEASFRIKIRPKPEGRS